MSIEILSFLTEQTSKSGALVVLLMLGIRQRRCRSPAKPALATGKEGLGVSIICDSRCAAEPVLDMEAMVQKHVILCSTVQKNISTVIVRGFHFLYTKRYSRKKYLENP